MAGSIFETSTGDLPVNNGDVLINTVGKTVRIKEGTGGYMGAIALVAGTIAVTIAGLTVNSRAFVQLATVGGTLGAGAVKAVCTTNTLTITSINTGGTLNTLDTSTYNYVIFQPAT